MYSQEVLAQKINLLMDSYPNFDASSQTEKKRILTEIFPEFIQHKKSEGIIFWIAFSLAMSGMLGVLTWSTIENIQSRRQEKRLQKNK